MTITNNPDGTRTFQLLDAEGNVWEEWVADGPTHTWECDCGQTIERFRGEGDQMCGECGQWFNASGQRLRNDWMDNPSMYDDDISDMEGFEMQQLANEFFDN